MRPALFPTPLKPVALVALACLLLTACDTVAPKREEVAPPGTGTLVVVGPPPAPISAPVTRPSPAAPESKQTTVVRSRLLGGRTITLPPVRPLVVSTRCNFINETGYKGDASVEVVEGVVRQMRVLVDVPEPNRGRCIFDMTGMVQTKSMPSVELHNRGTGCTARMWEQGSTAVVSFSNCASSCTNAESFKYVWPVLINRSSNHCD